MQKGCLKETVHNLCMGWVVNKDLEGRPFFFSNNKGVLYRKYLFKPKTNAYINQKINRVKLTKIRRSLQP